MYAQVSYAGTRGRQAGAEAEDAEELPRVMAMPVESDSTSLPFAQALDMDMLPLAAAPALTPSEAASLAASCNLEAADTDPVPLVTPGAAEPYELTEREEVYFERDVDLGATADPQLLHVMPAHAPHTEALGELASEDAHKLSVTIDECIAHRQQHVSHILDQHGVDAAVKDARNLLIGIKGITRDGKQDRWQYGDGSFASLAEALAAAKVLLALPSTLQLLADSLLEGTKKGGGCAAADGAETGDEHGVVNGDDLDSDANAQGGGTGGNEHGGDGSNAEGAVRSEAAGHLAALEEMTVVDHGAKLRVALADDSGLIGQVLQLPNKMWDGCEEDTHSCNCKVVGHVGERGYVIRTLKGGFNYIFSRDELTPHLSKLALIAVRAAALEAELQSEIEKGTFDVVDATVKPPKLRNGKGFTQVRALQMALFVSRRRGTRWDGTSDALEAVYKEEKARPAVKAAKVARLAARPCSASVREYISFFGEGSTEVEPMHEALSDAILNVYVEWHLPGGRLQAEGAQAFPNGATKKELQEAKCSEYRVPFDVFLRTACYASQHPRHMRKRKGVVSFPDVYGHRARARGKCLSSSGLRHMKNALEEHEGLERLMSDDDVISAYDQAYKEIAQFQGCNAQPLTNQLADAIIRQCNPRQLSGLRTIAWTTIAPKLKARTHEGLSLLHADLSIKKGEKTGTWSVPGFTKTTDGIAGRVDGWEHRCGCKLIGCSMHEALELPIEELLNSACQPCLDDGASGTTLDGTCAVCVTWCLQKMQGLSASPLDRINPIFQEVTSGSDGEERFNGNMVTVQDMLTCVRTAMEKADAERIARGLKPFPKEGRTLYMARHGGFIQSLLDGKSVEMAAKEGRISVATFLRYYRRHDLLDDPFEANGQFGTMNMKMVLARARSDGYLATETEIKDVLELCKVASIDTACTMPRDELYERLAPVCATRLELASACAALLRSACTRANADQDQETVRLITEDDEVSVDEMTEMLKTFAERSAASVLAQTVAALDGFAQNQLALVSGEGTALSSSSHALVLASGSGQAEQDAARPTPLLSPHLSDKWRQLARNDPTVRALFAEVQQRGLSVAAPPPDASLQLGSEAARLLPRVMAYRWRREGWMLCELVACNTNAEATLSGMPINFIVANLTTNGVSAVEQHSWQADCALRHSDYGMTSVNGWLLFEPTVPDAVHNKPLPLKLVPSTAAQAKHSTHTITAAKLKRLGGQWAEQSPPPPSDDALYEWLASPKRHLEKRDAACHEQVLNDLGGEGFVMLQEPGTQLTASSHFTPEHWNMKTHEIGAASEQWVEPAWSILEAASFKFMNASMQMVDAPWLTKKRASSGARLHALAKGDGASLAAVALVSPLPAERSVRALARLAGQSAKDAELLYIDAICASEPGAAYRLYCDLVADRRAQSPGKRLVVVLIAVVSSDVVRRYQRWGFRYGGEADATSTLCEELARFEHAFGASLSEPPSTLRSLPSRSSRDATMAKIQTSLSQQGLSRQPEARPSLTVAPSTAPPSNTAALNARPANGSSAPSSIVVTRGDGVACQTAMAAAIVAARARNNHGRFSRALFARVCLHGEKLPAIGLLSSSPDTVETALSERLKIQTELTGQGLDALKAKMEQLRTCHFYLMVVTGGHAGLFDEDHLWILSAKPTLLGLMFADMAHIVGKGRTSQLAFPRGGFQSLLRARITRGIAQKVIDCVIGRRLKNKVERDEAAAEVASLADDDERILSGEAVLNQLFVSLVRELHAPDGMFAFGLPSAVLDLGAPKIRVGALFVKEVATYFGCGIGLRRMSASTDEAEVIGVATEHARARDSTGEIRPYAATTIRRTKRVLRWFLQRKGWETMKVEEKRDKNGRVLRPGYTTIVVLEWRKNKKAYYNAIALSEQQKIFRAMAGTEDVAQEFVAQISPFTSRDLQFNTAVDVSKDLGLRASDARELTRGCLEFGASSSRADIKVVLARFKGSGEGFSRWLQHRRDCKYEYLSPLNRDGRGWSLDMAAGWALPLDRSIPIQQRCTACLLLMLLDRQNDAEDDTPVFRKLARTAHWSFKGGAGSSPFDFTKDYVACGYFNRELHAVMDRVNQDRANGEKYNTDSCHWHMWRHGAAMMSAIFDVSDDQACRTLRMSPSTLKEYREHVTAVLGAWINRAGMVDGSFERANRNKCRQMAVKALGESAAEDKVANLTERLARLCSTTKMSADVLRCAPPGWRQLILYGAAIRSPPLLEPETVPALLEALHSHPAHALRAPRDHGRGLLVADAHAAVAPSGTQAAPTSMPTAGSLDTSAACGSALDEPMDVDVGSEHDSSMRCAACNTSEQVQGQGPVAPTDDKDEQESGADDECDDAVSDAGSDYEIDDELTQVGSTEELHSMWHSLHSSFIVDLTDVTTGLEACIHAGRGGIGDDGRGHGGSESGETDQ